MPPRPPRSTLFPYTTLFRSFPLMPRGHNHENPLRCNQDMPSRTMIVMENRALLADAFKTFRQCFFGVRFRSEEHTSELQSRRDLVCRLLLEKKKKNVVREL